MHTCPMVTGTVPHVGGPILPPGEPTVLIGGLPAARVGDMAVCTGPPDTIAAGSGTVLIGGNASSEDGRFHSTRRYYRLRMSNCNNRRITDVSKHELLRTANS